MNEADYVRRFFKDFDGPRGVPADALTLARNVLRTPDGVEAWNECLEEDRQAQVAEGLLRQERLEQLRRADAEILAYVRAEEERRRRIRERAREKRLQKVQWQRGLEKIMAEVRRREADRALEHAIHA